LKTKNKITEITVVMLNLISIALALLILLKIANASMNFLFDVPLNISSVFLEMSHSGKASDNLLKETSNHYLSSGQIKGNIQIVDPPFKIVALDLLYYLVLGISILYGILILKGIIKSISEGNEFSPQNIKQIRILSFMIMILPFVLIFINLIFLMNLNVNISFNGVMFNSSMPTISYVFNEAIFSNLIYVVIGFAVYSISVAFEYGSKIKEEIDLTI